MEEQQVVEVKKSSNSLATKAAISYAAFFLALIYIFKLLGIDNNDPNMPIAEKIIYSIVTYTPYILAIIWVQTTFKKELGGFITFGKAFTAGFRVAAYTGPLLAIIMIVYFKLDTVAFNQIMDSSLAKAGDDENAIKGVEMMRPYMVFMIGFGAAISYTFFGLIVSLISAAFIKKEQSLY